MFQLLLYLILGGFRFVFQAEEVLSGVRHIIPLGSYILLSEYTVALDTSYFGSSFPAWLMDSPRLLIIVRYPRTLISVIVFTRIILVGTILVMFDLGISPIMTILGLQGV